MAEQICETPLKDWIKWDSGTNCSSYASRMAGGAWGGGIEMACASQLYKVNVHVYEKCGACKISTELYSCRLIIAALLLQGSAFGVYLHSTTRIVRRVAISSAYYIKEEFIMVRGASAVVMFIFISFDCADAMVI
jgi:hypothetical protein